jgi:hypothetical protein
MRSRVCVVGAATLVGGPTVLAFFSGGFFDRPRLIAGIVAWALVIVAAFLAPRPLPSSTPGRVALAGLALFTLWVSLSLLWAPLGSRAQDDLQRDLLYLGYFTAAIALLHGPIVRRWLEPTLLLGTFVIACYALSERLLPGIIELSRSRSAFGRLEQPITYWNAFGAVTAIGFVLALRISGDAERSKRLRGAAAVAGLPLALAVYLSFSRGALAAVAAGVVVLLALAPSGRPQLRSAVAMLSTGALAALVASRLPTVESLARLEQGDSGEGLIMLAALVVLGALAALVVVREPRLPPLPIKLPVSRRTAVLSLAVAGLLAALVAAATLEGRPEGVSPQAAANASRLRSIDTNRYRYWRVALDGFADRPLAGSGAGGFYVEWRQRPDRDDPSGDAHSLYLETAAELGVVGLAFLGMLIGGVAVALARLYRRDPALGTGLAAGFAVWAIHAGLDWDWEMPALTLIGLVLAGAGVAFSEEPERNSGDAGAEGICYESGHASDRTPALARPDSGSDGAGTRSRAERG